MHERAILAQVLAIRNFQICTILVFSVRAFSHRGNLLVHFVNLHHICLLCQGIQPSSRAWDKPIGSFRNVHHICLLCQSIQPSSRAWDKSIGSFRVLIMWPFHVFRRFHTYLLRALTCTLSVPLQICCVSEKSAAGSSSTGSSRRQSCKGQHERGGHRDTDWAQASRPLCLPRIFCLCLIPTSHSPPSPPNEQKASFLSGIYASSRPEHADRS